MADNFPYTYLIQAPPENTLDSGDRMQYWAPHPIRDAWNKWFHEFSSSLAQKDQKPNLEHLIATPERWGYVRRILSAIEKSARLRCWIDVATGDRV